MGAARVTMLDGGHFTSAAGIWRRGEAIERQGSESIGFFQLEQDAAFDAQVDLASLTKVVLTHLHFDHADGLALLPPSLPVYVQRREWEAGRDPDTIARNFSARRRLDRAALHSRPHTRPSVGSGSASPTKRRRRRCSPTRCS